VSKKISDHICTAVQTPFGFFDLFSTGSGRINPMILGVDTSSRRGSVALVGDGAVLDEIVFAPAVSFSSTLLEMVETIFHKNNLTMKQFAGNCGCIAVASGPGSFTGIRVGMATAQGIGISWGIPVFGVSTLDAIAASANSEKPFTAIVNAGKGNLYFADFDVCKRKPKRISPEGFDTACALLQGDRKRYFIGDEADIDSVPAEVRGISGVLSHSVAAGTALCAIERMKEPMTGVIGNLAPNYILKSSAERNLNL
jgi:tRNA threonylcarbamoyladenosine biosynthesis protein TsaB